MTRKKGRPKKVSDVKNKLDIIENSDGSITMKFNMGSAQDINGIDYSRVLMSNNNLSFSDGIQHPVSLKEDSSIDNQKPPGLGRGGFIDTISSGSRGKLWVDEYGDFRNEVWTRLSPGEIFIPRFPYDTATSTFNKNEVVEPAERYWSGGTNEDKSGNSVDIFVDRNEMVIGISRDGNGVMLPIDKEEAYKLIKLLHEAIYASNLWSEYLKQSPIKGDQDEVSNAYNEQTQSYEEISLDDENNNIY